MTEQPTGEARIPLVVVGVDGSEDALRAVTFGLRFALRRGADLLLINAVDDAVLAGSWGVVYDPAVLQRAGQAATETAKEFAISSGLPEGRIRTEVLLGNPAAVLTHMGDLADLIVVGRRSASGLERMFVGSTSVSVASAAACPVVVVSAATNPDPESVKGVVGVGLQSSASSLDTAEMGFIYAQLREARLRLIHVVQPPMGLFGPKMSPTELEQQVVYVKGGIDAMVGPLREKYPDVEVEIEVLAGSPINDLVNRSEELDLLVLGINRPGIPGFTLGGLTRGLMAHAKCPLLLTR